MDSQAAGYRISCAPWGMGGFSDRTRIPRARPYGGEVHYGGVRTQRREALYKEVLAMRARIEWLQRKARPLGRIVRG